MGSSSVAKSRMGCFVSISLGVSFVANQFISGVI